MPQLLALSGSVEFFSKAPNYDVTVHYLEKSYRRHYINGQPLVLAKDGQEAHWVWGNACLNRQLAWRLSNKMEIVCSIS